MTAPAIIQNIPVTQIGVASNVRISNGYDRESIANLAESISAHGLIQPIVLRHAADTDDTPSPYLVVAGRRRLAACKKLGMFEVPCIVAATDEAKAYELEIAENIQRENMTLADTARAVRTLMMIHDSAKAVGAIVNKSPAWVSKHLTVTASTFPTPLAELLESGKVSDMETLLLMHQVSKVPASHPRAMTVYNRLLRLAAAGSLSRADARDALASLKEHTGDAPPPVTTTTRTTHGSATTVDTAPADPRSTFAVAVPIDYLETYERLGGLAWLVDHLKAAQLQGGAA